MVEIKDIIDRESLREWLAIQSQKTSVTIANRMSMRLLLKHWHRAVASESNYKPHEAIMYILHQNLISGVASACPYPNIPENIAKAADYSLAIYLSYGRRDQNIEFLFPAAAVNTADAAVDVVSSATLAIAIENTLDVIAISEEEFLLQNTASELQFWGLIQDDCAESLNANSIGRVKLWHAWVNPNTDEWLAVKALLAQYSIDWSFWIKWYEAALNGKPLNWEMLERIALLPSEDWEKGPAHVNAIIAEIEGEFEWAEPEFEVTPAQMLNRNKSTIENQLAVLVQLVTEEINRIRGQNDFTKAEGEHIAARVSVLESIVAAVEKIRAALEGEKPSTALAVIEEQLPEVFEGAERLETLRPEDVLSGAIIGIGVAVKYLTDSGMSSTVATTVAVSDMVAKKISGLFGGKKKD